MDEAKNPQQPEQAKINSEQQQKPESKSFVKYVAEALGFADKDVQAGSNQSAGEVKSEIIQQDSKLEAEAGIGMAPDPQKAINTKPLSPKDILLNKAKEIGVVLQQKLEERKVRLAQEAAAKKSKTAPNKVPAQQASSSGASYID